MLLVNNFFGESEFVKLSVTFKGLYVMFDVPLQVLLLVDSGFSFQRVIKRNISAKIINWISF